MRQANRNEWLSPDEDERWKVLLHLADAINATYGEVTRQTGVVLRVQTRSESHVSISPLELPLCFIERLSVFRK